MGLSFYKKSNCGVRRVSVCPTVKQLTPRNKKFLESIGLRVKNEYIGRWAKGFSG